MDSGQSAGGAQVIATTHGMVIYYQREVAVNLVGITINDLSSRFCPIWGKSMDNWPLSREVLHNLHCWRTTAPAVTWRGGLHWYDDAIAECDAIAERTGRDAETVRAVVALLSPRCEWRRNLLAAELACIAGHARECRVLGNAEAKATAALSGRPLSAILGDSNYLKVASFAAALLGNTEAVTIDTWMYRALLGDTGARKVKIGSNLYRYLSRHIYHMSAEWGINPRDLQSAVWCSVIEYAYRVRPPDPWVNAMHWAQITYLESMIAKYRRY